MIIRFSKFTFLVCIMISLLLVACNNIVVEDDYSPIFKKNTVESGKQDNDIFSESSITTNIKTDDVYNTNIFHDIPMAYNDILIMYRDMVESWISDHYESDINENKFQSPNPELLYKWHNMLIDAPRALHEKKASSFGYTLDDINKDGTLELLLMRKDKILLALFTEIDGTAVLIDAFWSRYDGVILENGQLFTNGNSGAYITEYTVKELDNNSTSFTTVRKFGSNIVSGTEVEDNNQIIYYDIKEDTLTKISRDRYLSILDSYPTFPLYGEKNTLPYTLKYVPIDSN